MPSIPHIKESTVRRWTDEVYFQRGKNYFEQGAIYDQRRQGMMLKSKCAGTQAPFYRQEVLFNSKGIEYAECSCPIGAGGRCKHSVALLLTWVNDPDSFKEVEAMDAALEKRSKAELITLIQQMLEQEPDLEFLLELPLSAEEKEPLDIKTIRKQAQRAFGGSDIYDEWVSTWEVERNLDSLLNLAEGYLTRKDPDNAALIYQTVIETIMDHEDEAMGDEEGALLEVIYDCCEALGKCLSSIGEAKKRHRILQALFNAYRWDAIEEGGIGAADPVPEILVSKTTPEERKEIAKWTRKIMPKGKDWSDGYHREVLGRLLLDLEADTLDDEAYLKICRETGRLNDLIERLLQLQRIKEAEEAAKAAEDYDLLEALEIFTKHRQADLAEKLVAERLEAAGREEMDERLIEWLSNRFKQRGDLAGSLKLEEQIFWQDPNIEQYKKLRKLAKGMNRWESLRPQIMSELEKKKDFEFLIDLYLLEKEVGKALATLEKVQPDSGDQYLYMEVAQAAKKEYPREAIRIFTREAERFIDYRNRDSYSQAALCLREIRDIYRQLNEAQSWQKLITDVREWYKRLPALQDELDRRKL